MATLNTVIDKKYTQNASSYFATLKAEDIQKVSAWLKRHNFYIEEKFFKDGSTTLSIGTRDYAGIFHQVIYPLTETEEGLEGQFTAADLVEFIDAAGEKTLTGKAKSIMERVIGIKPNAAEDLSADDPTGYVLHKLKNSPLFEQDYASFWKMLVDRDHLRNLEAIEKVGAQPKKVEELINKMQIDQAAWDLARADWEKQRQEMLVKEEEGELEAS